MKRVLLALLASAALSVSPAGAQQSQTSPAATPSPEAPESDAVKRAETVTVASKIEQAVIEAPLAIGVITAETIMIAPSRNLGDLVRSEPGINVIQTGPRDFNITARQGTSTLSNSQLALVDGRSIYLDFFGLILWDFVPSNPDDIKQIEVVRGPASAVWGANALTGVINIVTKIAARDAGRVLTLTGGLFSRDAGSRVGDDAGKTFGASAGWAAAPNATWSYRVSAGYFNSDPWPRPVRNRPRRHAPRRPADQDRRRPLSRLREPGHEPAAVRPARGPGAVGRQPHLLLGGRAGSDGMIHTGIGPFDIQQGSYGSYGRVAFNRGRLRISGFANLFDAKAPNVLTVDAITGRPVELNFKTQTYDLEVGHSAVLAGRHILSYGGNARRNNFDISIAPGAKDRNEFGAYFQDEIFIKRFRFVIGGRVDKFGNLEDPVFSPRLAAMFKPAPGPRVPALLQPRVPVSFGHQQLHRRADQVRRVPAGSGRPTPRHPHVPVPTRTIGSEVARTINPEFHELTEERLTAYEVGYAGTFGGRTTVGVSYYINDTDDNINFTTTGSAIAAAGLPAYFTSSNPPPGWPLPPAVLDLLAARGIRLPALSCT